MDARVICVSLAALLASGCAKPNPLAERRVADRLESMGRTVQAFEKSEASRPGNLEHAFAVIDQSIRDDQAKLDRDLNYLNRVIQQQFTDWDRRQADYRRVGGDIFNGNPESIERTAILLFY